MGPSRGFLLSLFLSAMADLDYVSYDYALLEDDEVSPQVIGIVPGNLSVDVALDVTIHIYFSELILAGTGDIELTSDRDIRLLTFAEEVVLVTQGEQGNRSIQVKPDRPLRPALAYRVRLRRGVVHDLVGNQLEEVELSFRTAGVAESFAVFAPYVQTPGAPLLVAFRTHEHGLYGSLSELYRLELWASGEPSLFELTASFPECSNVLELSESFPALESCSSGETFAMQLRSPLFSDQEYSLVLYWPVGFAAVNATWSLLTARTYGDSWLEVERFEPWVHHFQDYLVEGSDASLTSLQVASLNGITDAAGLDSLQEFEFTIQFGAGIPGGSRLRLFGFPLLGWSSDVSRPSNVSMLEALVQMDAFALSGPWRRVRACTGFFPGDLPGETACKLLAFGGGPAFGVELRTPSRSATLLPDRPHKFTMTVAGIKQPLAAAVHWEAILSQTVAGVLSHSPLVRSNAVMLSNTTAMTLDVLNSSYTYPAPMGSIINRVELAIQLKVLAAGARVVLELVEPRSARIETCEPVPGFARLGSRGVPEMTMVSAAAAAVWRMGNGLPAMYPHVTYRASCLVYNGPQTAAFSSWRLSVEVEVGSETISFQRLLRADRYFVIPVLAGGQVLPGHPVLGRWQVIYVRIVTPARDGFSLLHWTQPSHTLQVSAPAAGFFVPGACPGFRPLRGSLPPLPLSSCQRVGETMLEIRIDAQEPGFEPGQTYAFQSSVQNPSTLGEAVDNGWSFLLLDDQDLPIASMENVPSVLSAVTAALRPNDPAELHDTSFRLFKKQLSVLAITAEDPIAGRATKVQLEFVLTTPLRTGDALIVTAPSLFRWVQPAELHFPGTAATFPALEPDVNSAAPWMLVAGVLGDALAATAYVLGATVLNPGFESWDAVEAELNYWQLETIHRHTSFWSLESRRDTGMRKGYAVVGPLQHCVAVPSSQLLNVESWVSLTFQASEPVGVQSWRQPELPSTLRISLPNGFLLPEGQGCSGLIDRADPQYPQLPLLKFPFAYLPLPLEEATCSATLETLQIGLQRLLPHYVYTFRLRVVSPRQDQMRGRIWALATLTVEGSVRESCTMEAWPSANSLEGLSLQPTLAMPTLPVSLVLQGLALPNVSLIEVQAAGVRFFHNCAAPGLPGQCVGDKTRARVSASSALSLLELRGRMESTQSEPWSVLLVAGSSVWEASVGPGPGLLALPWVRLQPQGSGLFRAENVVQGALLAMRTDRPVPAGGFLQLAMPGQTAFVFAEKPCKAALQEQFLPLAVVDGQASGAVASCNTSESCVHPRLFSCERKHSSSTLLVRVAEALTPQTLYCFDFMVLAPEGRTVPDFPLVLLTQDEAGALLEVSPLLGPSGGQGMAPVVQSAAHLSLCSPSRLSSDEPRQLVLHFALNSLLSSSLSRLVARFCFSGLQLSFGPGGALSCEALEPSAEISCTAVQGCGSCVAVEGTDLLVPFQKVAISLPALVPAGSLLGVNMELVGILSTESVLQGAIFTSPLPMLPLLPVALIAPEAPTLDGFQVEIQLERLNNTELLDVSLPVGLSVDTLTCSPRCVSVPPSLSSPEPVLRFFLGEETSTSTLSMELYASAPLGENESWQFVSRSGALQALGAVARRGFAVAYPVDFGIGLSSQRAGDAARVLLNFRLFARLEAGALVKVAVPPGLASEPTVEPQSLFQWSTSELNSTWQFQVLQDLSTGVTYSISVPITNPVQSPSSTWRLQLLLSTLHSVGTSAGFQVLGEFESFTVLARSSVPEVSTPSLVRFQLRTPLPAENWHWRLIASTQTFDPGKCILDVFTTSYALPVHSFTRLIPDDCLVSADGSSAQFIFSQSVTPQQDYGFWIWTTNPSSGAFRIFTASTLLSGSSVHQASYRSSLSGLQAVVIPGSYTAGALHRAVLSVTSGTRLEGQRGSIELRLPSGFAGSCGFFRVQASLPSTARCRALGATASLRPRIQVYWRSLFGAELTFPLEFAFALQNAFASDESNSTWSATIFEGENQDLAIASGTWQSWRPCEALPPLPGGLRVARGLDPAVVSVAVNLEQVTVAPGFDTALRVELKTSQAAPAELYCPDSSIWQARDLFGLGSLALPRYTKCVEEPRVASVSRGAQHSSAVLFLLPYQRFVGSVHGLEVVMRRSQQGFVALEPSASEAAAELVNVYLEAANQRLRCGSALLGAASNSTELAGAFPLDFCDLELV
ncbi:unnamed protein product [Effrenium voratum]|nr:unnamed protein product [Effrenium voratum]